MIIGRRHHQTLLILMFCLLLLSACGGETPAQEDLAAPTTAADTTATTGAYAVQLYAANGRQEGLSTDAYPTFEAIPASENKITNGNLAYVAEPTIPIQPTLAVGAPQATPGVAAAPFQADPNRKIIKHGDMAIETDIIQTAINQINAATTQLGGYLLETRTDFGNASAQRATMSLAVPVDQFETMQQRIREAGKRLLSEQSSGKDATQEYVDIQSQIANLEATQARIRGFLEQATDVDEALSVNAKLTEIEGQISVLKGRLQFLGQRAAYSTISVLITQEPPPATATPTASPTATPTPSPTPSATPTPVPGWEPGKTADEAYGTLSVILQGIGSVLIWFAVVVLPFGIPALLVWKLVGWGLRRGRKVRETQPVVTPPSEV